MLRDNLGPSTTKCPDYAGVLIFKCPDLLTGSTVDDKSE